MVGALDQDYVSFARARGVPSRRVMTRYALRNALVPIITAGGLVLTVVLTGTVLVETTFALPGLGTLLVEAVEFKDLPVLQGIGILLAVADRAGQPRRRPAVCRGRSAHRLREGRGVTVQDPAVRYGSMPRWRRAGRPPLLICAAIAFLAVLAVCASPASCSPRRIRRIRTS